MGVEQKVSGRERVDKERGGVGAIRLWCLSNKRHLMKDRESAHAGLPTAISVQKPQQLAGTI